MAQKKSYEMDPDELEAETDDKVVGGYAKNTGEYDDFPDWMEKQSGIREAPYKESDLSRPPEDIARTQNQMVKAGVLKGKYKYGIWDPATRGAFEDVLIVANAAGMSWEQALNRWSELERDSDGDGEARQGRAYQVVAPNAARLRKQNDDLARNLLGRRLTEDEREAMVQAAIMADVSQQERSNAVEQATSVKGAGDQTLRTEELDPLATMEEQIKKKYAPEYGAHEIAGAGEAFFSMLGGD